MCSSACNERISDICLNICPITSIHSSVLCHSICCCDNSSFIFGIPISVSSAKKKRKWPHTLHLTNQKPYIVKFENNKVDWLNCLFLPLKHYMMLKRMESSYFRKVQLCKLNSVLWFQNLNLFNFLSNIGKRTTRSFLQVSKFWKINLV